jgi:hypothetical protein
MPLTVRARLASLLVGGLVCAGCQGGAPTAAKPYASQPAPARIANPPPSAAARAELASPRTGLPEPLDPNLEQTNKDGVKVKVTRVTFEPKQILVDLVATNSSSHPVVLAGSPFTGMTLIDDKGTSYNFQAPKRNRAFRVAPGQTHEGRATFLGALVSDASSLTLTLNAGSGGDRFVPRFEFANIAVPAS